MELASFMKARGMRAVVEWAPRECDREADLLANGITDLFNPERRCTDVGVEYPSRGSDSRKRSGTDVQASEGKSWPTEQAQKQWKRKVETRLKVTDPW